MSYLRKAMPILLVFFLHVTAYAVTTEAFVINLDIDNDVYGYRKHQFCDSIVSVTAPLLCIL
jgi:hypothetical protein